MICVQGGLRLHLPKEFKDQGVGGAMPKLVLWGETIEGGNRIKSHSPVPLKGLADVFLIHC